METIKDAPLRLVVIGGGFTGATLVVHAIAATRRALAVTVIEPAAEVGRGTAYGTDDQAHRINVPSDIMTIRKDNPGEATSWCLARGILPDPESDDGTGQYYIPRRVYGSFIIDVLRQTVADAGPRVRYRHVEDAATRVVRADGSWQVTTAGGETVPADLVAFCFGHAAPAAPCAISDTVARQEKFVANPWAKDAFAAIEADDDVLIVGTGLTMADVVMSLRTTGRDGPITAISRRALLPRPQGLFLSKIGRTIDLFGGENPPRTALGLLRLMRRLVRESDPELGWQPIVDQLRAVLPDVWNGLPIREQRQVLRRLLPYWDVHRFRIAPTISAALDRERESGRLAIAKAGLAALSFKAEDGRFTATLKAGGGMIEQHQFDAVVLCTGPDRNLANHALVSALLADGVAALDGLGLGLAVDRSSRILDMAGQPTKGLFAFGPITRPSFGEMTGAPDIAAHIEATIHHLFHDHPAH
ncbi:FAD/NAD(P)-binding protein [Jiella flava]|uniref:FAD/NAD(P)-binding protein n=1 Tax=Jiella flava TaxID=2816857 RepID=A0A939FYJ0_9HYPH|nr:FAD/NAD(P)-binding protein [Jiella flava]